MVPIRTLLKRGETVVSRFDLETSSFSRAAPVFACVCLRPEGGVGWDYHHGTHRPTGHTDISQQKHHSQGEDGPVGERATECVPVEDKRTVNACKLAPSDVPVEMKP